jgi:hypothetical protein
MRHEPREYDSSHVFVLSHPKAGTRWVRDMFAENVLCVRKDIVHEAFRTQPVRTLRRWKEPGLHIAVCYSSTWIPQAYREFPELRMAVIMRDPIDSALSLLSHRQRGKPKFDEPGHFSVWITEAWGLLNRGLQILEELNIDAPRWHFDYYTTLTGFKELANSIDVQLVDRIKYAEKTYETDRGDRIYREEVPNILIEQLEEAFAGFKYLKQAHDKAKAEAQAKLGD